MHDSEFFWLDYVYSIFSGISILGLFNWRYQRRRFNWEIYGYPNSSGREAPDFSPSGVAYSSLSSPPPHNLIGSLQELSLMFRLPLESWIISLDIYGGHVGKALCDLWPGFNFIFDPCLIPLCNIQPYYQVTFFWDDLKVQVLKVSHCPPEVWSSCHKDIIFGIGKLTLGRTLGI